MNQAPEAFQAKWDHTERKPQLQHQWVVAFFYFGRQAKAFFYSKGALKTITSNKKNHAAHEDHF